MRPRRDSACPCVRVFLYLEFLSVRRLHGWPHRARISVCMFMCGAGVGFALPLIRGYGAASLSPTHSTSSVATQNKKAGNRKVKFHLGDKEAYMQAYYPTAGVK